MHFIDVGFKQSGSSENNNCYFETIFYGLNENLEEVDLYKWQEIHRGIEVISQESVLETLTSYEWDELLDLIESKKENYFNNFNSDFINKISDKNVKIKKSYNFGDKIQLLKQLSEEISNKKRGLNKEEMANYETIFKQKSDVNYTIGDYVVLALWDVFKECLIKEQIDLLIKFNSNYDRYLEYCILQLNFENLIRGLEDTIVEQSRKNRMYFEVVRNNQMNKNLMNIRKVIEKTEGPEIASTSIYMEFEDNTTANLYNAKTRTISKISFSNKLSILKLYMKKIIEGNFEHDDLAWLNILFNEVNTEKEQREKDLNDLFSAIRILIFTKNPNIVDFVSAKLEEINDEDKKVKEYAL